MAVRAHEFKSLNYVEKANKSTACYLKTLKARLKLFTT